MLSTLHYHNGHTLAYAECGDPHGFPVLVQHGLIASIQDQPLFDPLAALGARVISIARPGYGESSPYAMQNIGAWAEVVAALVDHLGLTQFDVLGISSGAPYAYALGCGFPDRVKNLFILSGIPALYDEEIRSLWPYPDNQQASIAELQTLAYDLFFANLSEAQRAQADVQDSMRNQCFGLAQDFKLRCADWGFRLPQVQTPVWMRHSRRDETFAMAELTAQRLPHCRFDIRENDAHFSAEVLSDFIQTVMAGRLGA